jgi:hypothetical protein
MWLYIIVISCLFCGLAGSLLREYRKQHFYINILILLGWVGFAMVLWLLKDLGG